MNETWKPIRGYEGYYEVSNLGRVKSLMCRKGKRSKPFIKKSTKSQDGRYRMCLQVDKNPKIFFLHRLIAETFIPNPKNKPHINHKDGNPSNNRIENLEWCTNSENMKHAYKNGLIRRPVGENNGNAKLTQSQVDYIRWTSKVDPIFKVSEVAKKHNVAVQTIYSILNGKLWKRD